MMSRSKGPGPSSLHLAGFSAFSLVYFLVTRCFWLNGIILSVEGQSVFRAIPASV